MTPYGTKTMELSDAYAYSALKMNNNVDKKREVLHQHIERGEQDCRTCKYLELHPMYCCAESRHGLKCINFSQYKKDDSFVQLCEKS